MTETRMDWQHNMATGIWELVDGGWHAVVLPEGNGLWNGFVEPVRGDDGERIFCPQLDPQVEHIKAWCMTEVARQQAAAAAGAAR
jgi:hypothetical protein